MSVTSQTQHDELLKAVAERYRRDGYEIYPEPPASAVPFDLGGFRPDLIARRKHEGVIVQVKAGAQKTSFEGLRSVVDEVRRHKGWQFVLITPEDVLNDLPDSEEQPLSWEEIGSRITSARQLSHQGYHEAAYIALWIAFELALRLQARQVSLPLDRLTPGIAIRQLYSLGELTMSQYDAALACQEVRNRIVHGFPASDPKSAVQRLESLLNEVVEQWKHPVPEN